MPTLVLALRRIALCSARSTAVDAVTERCLTFKQERLWQTRWTQKAHRAQQRRRGRVYMFRPRRRTSFDLIGPGQEVLSEAVPTTIDGQAAVGPQPPVSVEVASTRVIFF
jgi:hypothetical protein